MGPRPDSSYLLGPWPPGLPSCLLVTAIDPGFSRKKHSPSVSGLFSQLLLASRLLGSTQQRQPPGILMPTSQNHHGGIEIITTSMTVCMSHSWERLLKA